MQINTRNFGKLEVSERNVICFDEGLLGMEEYKKFVMLNNTDTDGPVPFMWLQCMDHPDVAFVITIPYLLRNEYEVDIPDEICEKLEIDDPHDVAIYSIVKINGPISNATMNLQSPIVINANNYKGAQIVMHDMMYGCEEKCTRY